MQDSLMPLAQYMHHALGSDHAVTVVVQRLADANLSSATKRRQQEEQKLLEVETAELWIWLPRCETLLWGVLIATHTLLSLMVHLMLAAPASPAERQCAAQGGIVFLRGKRGGGGQMQHPMPPAAVSTGRILSFLLVCSHSAPLVLSQPAACLQ